MVGWQLRIESGRPVTEESGRPVTEESGRPVTEESGRAVTEESGRIEGCDQMYPSIHSQYLEACTNIMLGHIRNALDSSLLSDR